MKMAKNTTKNSAKKRRMLDVFNVMLTLERSLRFFRDE